jgi:hypothetical protein
MNKIIALVLAFSLMATMVFAEPVVLASEIVQTTDLIPEDGLNTSLFSDFAVANLDTYLFADVGGTPLSADESHQVEGGIIPPPVVVAVAAVVLVCYVGNMVMKAVQKK